MNNLGLQLYTIKEYAQADLLNTLQKVADIGYDGVEFAGFYGNSLESIKAKLQETGLKVAATHISYDDILNDFDNNIAICKELSIPTIICPYLGNEYFNSIEAINSTIAGLTLRTKMCAEHGIRYLYHIHGQEFSKINSEYALDILMRNSDPKYLNFEVDTYWIEHADVDSYETYKKYHDRMPYIHFKDMKDKVTKQDAEVGTGIVKVNDIIKLSKTTDTLWYVVEQEAFDIDPMDSVKISHDNLRAIAKKIG